MALKLIVDFCIKKEGIFIYDNTGLYHVDDNPTGWGAPNIAYTDVVSSKFIVTNITTNQSVEIINPFITTADLEESLVFGPYDNVFEDGIITVDYEIIDSMQTTYTACKKKFYMINVDCCVDTLISQVPAKYDDKIFIDRVMRTEALRHALKIAALCLDETKIEKYLTKFKSICKSCATV